MELRQIELLSYNQSSARVTCSLPKSTVEGVASTISQAREHHIYIWEQTEQRVQQPEWTRPAQFNGAQRIQMFSKCFRHCVKRRITILTNPALFYKECGTHTLLLPCIQYIDILFT